MRTRRELTEDDDDVVMVEHHCINLREFFAQQVEPSMSPSKRVRLERALRALDERQMFPDECQVSFEQAIFIWRVVERVRRFGFPNALCV